MPGLGFCQGEAVHGLNKALSYNSSHGMQLLGNFATFYVIIRECAGTISLKGANGDGGDGAGSDNDDCPFGKLSKRRKADQAKYWMQINKPLKGEDEEEYSKRITEMVSRGVKAQERLRRKKGTGEPSQPVDPAVGTAARLFFESVKGGASERRPTRIFEDMETANGEKGYHIEWKEKGYIGRTAWKSADWVGKYPGLLEDYEKVPSPSCSSMNTPF